MHLIPRRLAQGKKHDYWKRSQVRGTIFYRSIDETPSMNSRMMLALLLFTSLLAGSLAAAESAPTDADKNQEEHSWVRRLSFGIVLHDVGFISDKREKGVDPNWEVQFNRPEWRWWHWLGS